MKLYNKYSEEILNSLTSGIVTINKNFEITFVNESAENIIGLKKEKIIGKICNSICKDDNCENNCPIALAIDTGKKKKWCYGRVWNAKDNTEKPKRRGSWLVYSQR